MLTRVNIHLASEALKKLDAVAQKLNNLKDNNFWFFSVSRADLIRYAIGIVFKFDNEPIHTSDAKIGEALKKLDKKK